MDVVLDLSGHVEVEHVLDVGKVETLGRDVGSHKHVLAAGLQSQAQKAPGLHNSHQTLQVVSVWIRVALCCVRVSAGRVSCTRSEMHQLVQKQGSDQEFEVVKHGRQYAPVTDDQY